MPRTSPRPAPAAPATTVAPPFPVAGRAVFMIGIGGCGMAGLARMLRARGGIVCGSDMAVSETTEALAAEGIAIDFDQSHPWLPDACDLVIASAAIKPDHPQLLEAQRRAIPTLMYAEALGRCMAGRTAVAVAGTHGKSTTTAMLGAALVDAGLDPTVIVGATCAQLESGSIGAPGVPTGFRLGADAIPAGAMAGRAGALVAEACEFNRSFHNYHPLIASISAVEADHLDVYGTFDAVIESFNQFARQVATADAGGRLLIAYDGAQRVKVCAGVTCAVETIGFSPAADWVVSYDPATRGVTLAHQRTIIAGWTINLPGEHNAMNSATACALATMLGADPARIALSLSAFRGVDRRTQFLGERPCAGGGVVRVYDDYGHHPTEVDSTLRALRHFERLPEKPGSGAGRLICVFQPHQHSRTRHLLDEFVSAFSSADLVIVPDIYFVRDSISEKHKVSAADLVDRLRARGVSAMHLYPFEAIVEQLDILCRAGDLLVVMGAGPVWKIARGFLSAPPGPGLRLVGAK